MGHETSLVGEIDRCIYLNSFHDAVRMGVRMVLAFFRFAISGSLLLLVK